VFKSKIFLKAMFIVTSMILIYTLSISVFTIPKVENSIKNLEEKNAREVLKKVVMIVKNGHKDLENFKKIIFEKHKEELKNLTDTVWSIVHTKYNQSKLENVGILLKKRSLEFKSNLTKFYNNNKNKMSEDELKSAMISHINIYRYNNGTGYFWVNDFTPKMITHPILPELNNRHLENYKDSNGIYVFNEMVDIARAENSGITQYMWLNPKSKKIEKKISYIFKFEPFNWIIGTGEYYSVLKQRLQDEVFELINKVRYSHKNYFFVSNYHNVLLSHPTLQGENFSKTRDKKGNLIIPPMVKIAREKGEGFYSYWWEKNNTDNNIYEKLSFVKNFPDWKLIIGTGVYIDDIEAEVAKRKEVLIKQLRDVISSTKLGKTGYLYIFNHEGKMLIHPNENLNNNRNFYKIQTPITGTLIYDDLVNASKTKNKSLNYKWDKPSDKGNYIYDKISWVEYIPQLDWYIGSSVYTEEFKDSANHIRDFVIFTALVILALSLLYSFLFFKNLLLPITVLSKLVLKVSKGDYSTRYTLNHKNDEVGILVDKFNEMVNLIENRTHELEDSNKELKQSISDLKKTQKKLIEVEKMAGLGGLVAGVAHEINTPVGIGLTGVTHLLDITDNILKDYKSDNISQEEFEEYLHSSKNLANIINVNINKTAHLIRSFKQIAVDQTSEEKREFNLAEYIDEVLLNIHNDLKKTNLSVIISCEKNMLINSYPGAYSQILSHLILNTIRHGYDTKAQGKIFIDILKNKNTLTIYYKDEGKGISNENLSKIFEPFFTTNRENGGMGLGLNIIYNIITNNLKGKINCSNRKEAGVLFEIIIPL